MNVVFHAEIEGFTIEDIGRVDNWRRLARDLVARSQGTADLARTHRIDQCAMPAEQVQYGQIRAGLLGVAT